MRNNNPAVPAAHQSLAALVDQLDLAITYLPVNSLVAYGRKTRAHTKAQVESLARVIGEIGFLVPVIVDEAGKVLAGNARIEAARKLAFSNVPAVTVSHLSPAQKRVFAIADNRLAEMAGWDREALAIELEELRNIDVTLNLELTGFSSAEIDGLSASVRIDDNHADRFDFASAPVVSQPGDLWLLGDHQLTCGDATDPVVVGYVMQGKQARTVFTDPPYNLRIDGQVIRSRGHGEFVMGSGELTDPRFTEFLSKVWGNVDQFLIPGGLAFLCMDWRHQRHTLAGMDGKSLELLNLIVWNKTAPGMGGFYRSQHELIFLAKKGGGQHLNCIKFGEGGRSRSNVWTYAGVQGFGSAKSKLRELHPTVKPMAMVRDAILDSSEPGEVILDLFSGSGTTLIAAEVSKRKGRAVELDPLYVDTGVVRWQDFTGREATLAETGETFTQLRARRAATSTMNNKGWDDDAGSVQSIARAPSAEEILP